MQQVQLVESIKNLGAYKVAVIAVDKIPFNPEFRKACETNACGMYGQSWMCPPHVGEINELIKQAQGYSWACVYQTVGQLEDSYDIEGMLEAGKQMNNLSGQVRKMLCEEYPDALFLGAGGCRLCSVCAKREDQPCRYPDQAMSSLEAYGISVSDLAAKCDMKYINGQNTVTYFGAVLFR